MMLLFRSLFLVLIVISPFWLVAKESSVNTFQSDAMEKFEAIEQRIKEQLDYRKVAETDFQRPVLVSDFAVEIPNPLSNVPVKVMSELQDEGINLTAYGKHKALYLSGSLTGANARTLVNDDENVLLIIGDETATHSPIFSRGPIVVTGKTYLMDEVISADWVWFGEEANSSESAIGLPVILSAGGNKKHSFGESLLTPEQEERAKEAMGELQW